MLGLRFCARAFSSCGKRGPLFIAVRGPLTIVASLAAEHRLQTRRLSSCGSRASLLCGMWDLPRPGLEPVSPALAGRFSTTAPPGKPLFVFNLYFIEVTLVYNIIQVSCIKTLYFYFCIHYSVLTTKNLVSIHRHTVDSPLPISPSPMLTPTLFSVSTCLFLFGLICSFILLFACFFVLHI